MVFNPLLIFFFKIFLLIIPVLISVAFITLLERKILSIVGFRIGPNKVSFVGILQPISDALKLSNKESNSLGNFSYFFYYFASFFLLFCSLLLWVIFMSEPLVISFKLSFLLFFLILGFNSLSSIVLGWRTFSKFSLLGRIRTVSQLISYESVLYLVLFFFLMSFNVYNFYSYRFYPVSFFVLLFPLCFYFWFPSFLAELNRTPYDFSEGESELVRGFNTEFGSLCFTLIFLSEYSIIIFFCVLSRFLFFWNFFTFFFYFFVFFVVWVRSVLPRYRFDKLMFLCWRFIVPFLTCFFIMCVVYIF